MVGTLEIPNGIPMYLLVKLTEDFKKIFCHAFDNSIYFIGARNHLAVKFRVYKRRGAMDALLGDEKIDWNYTYVFDGDELKREIVWFKNKTNSRKNMNLSIIPERNTIRLYNEKVNAKLNSLIDSPPLPKIPEMKSGMSIKIGNLREMVNQIKSISEEVIKLNISDSILKMSGSEFKSPIYTVRLTQSTKLSKEISTLCYKHIFLISCEWAQEINTKLATFQFYPMGATQLRSTGQNMSIRCLLTAVPFNVA